MSFNLSAKEFEHLQKSVFGESHRSRQSQQDELDSTALFLKQHRKPEEQGFIADFTDSVQMGAWQGLSDLSRGLGVVFNSDWLNQTADWAAHNAEANRQTMSSKMQQALGQSAFDGWDSENGEGKGVLNAYWWAGNFGALLGQQLDTVATLGAGKIATTGLKMAGKQAGKMLSRETAEQIGKAATQQAARFGIPQKYHQSIGVTAVMSAMQAGGRANQVFEEIDQLSDEQLAQLDGFRQDYWDLKESEEGQGLDDRTLFDQAKARFKQRAGKDAALDPVALATDLTTNAISGLGGGVWGAMKPAQTLKDSFFKGGAIEALTEGMQGAAETYAVNDTARNFYDTDRTLTEGMGRNVVDGMVLGSVMGAGMGALDTHSHRRTMNRERKRYIEAIQTGDEVIDAHLRNYVETVNNAANDIDELISQSRFNAMHTMAQREARAKAAMAEVKAQAEAQQAETSQSIFTTEAEPIIPTIIQPTSAQTGATTQLQLGSQGQQQADYELVEASELTVNLKPNVYQNRDRTSADSQMQINDYARNLNPAYLGASVDVTQGAPTVDENYGVFAGNGRLAAIQQAYQHHPQQAVGYKQFLANNAKQFGFSAEQVNAMQQPVLVRKVKGNIDVAKAVEEGNFNTGLDKGVLGDATANAKYLTPDLLREVQINEDGSLNLSDSNTPFIQGLIGKIPVEQRPKFFAEQRLGNQSAYTLTAQGKEMVENALLVKAFSDPNNPTYSQNLLTDLIVSTDESSKRVKNALISVAGKVIQTQNNPDFDISGDIAQAYALMRQGKQEGKNIDDLLAQQDFVNPPSKRVQAITRLFYSPKSVREVQEPLNAYFDSVINSNLDQTQQESMFGDEFAIDRDELMRNAGVKYSRSAQEIPSFYETEQRLGGKEAYESAVRNGKTELDYRQWVQVRTSEFKAWFGDWENDPENASKVVNPKTGEPLVVYHGTDKEFSTFDRSKNNPNNEGFYFSDKQELSKKFAGSNGRVLNNFLNIRNPDINGFDGSGAVMARSDYSDGGIFTKRNSDRYAEKGTKEIIAFDPNQIKSATDNTGAFNPNNDDIRFSKALQKPDRLEKLRQAKPIEISGAEIQPSDDLRQYKRNALEYGKSLRGAYTNKDTGKTIELGAGGVKEILQHDYKDVEHLQSIAAIPQIIENAIYIDTLPNEDKGKNFAIDGYEYYLAGLKIGGKDYTVRAVIGVTKDGDRYYDHKLTKIEKGELLSLPSRITNPVGESSSPLSDLNDKRLLQILQQQNAKLAQTHTQLKQMVGEKLAEHFNVVSREQLGITDPTIEAGYDPNTGKIFIVEDNIRGNGILSRDERLKWVAWHELAHRGVQVKFAHQYRNLMTKIEQNTTVRELADAIQQQREETRNNRLLAVEEALAELNAAYSTGKMDELKARYGIVVPLGREKSLRAWFEMTAERIREFVARLFGKETAEKFSQDDLINLIKDIQSGMGGEIDRQGNNELKHSFAGENAKTADRSLLEQAKQAVSSGVDPETVRQQTGWFKGVDGEWRFEIDDRSMNLKGEYSKDARAFDVIKSLREVNKNPPTLGDMFEAPDLFSAYPDLAKMEVQYDMGIKEGGDAYYSPARQGKDDFIAVNPHLSVKHLKTTLIHEIQHAIQERENFAKGSSPSHFSEQELQNLSPLEAYHRTAGEVEARNAQWRSVFNKEARRKISPFETQDVASDDQIIHFNDGESYSLNENVDSDFAKAIDEVFNSQEDRFDNSRWVDLGTTPDALIQSGIDDKVMKINFAKIAKIKKDHPEMTADLLKQIPRELNNPVAVFKNTKGKPNSYVVLTELTVKGNERVIAALHAEQEVDGLVFHKLASAYGKDGTRAYLENMIEKSEVRFVDKQKASRINSKLQLLAEDTIDLLFNKASVVKDDSNVNGFKFSRTQTNVEKLRKINENTPLEKLGDVASELANRPLSEWKALMLEFGKRANSKIFDALAPIKYAEDKAGIRDHTQSAYTAARLAAGSASISEATMLYGLPEYRDGIIQRKQGTGEQDALFGILQSLGNDANDFLAWVAGSRADKLMKEGRENHFSQAEIDELKALNKGKEAKFEQARQKLMAFNTALLDLAENAGLINKEERAKWEDKDFYIPFYRETEDGDAIAPYRNKGLSGQSSGIKRLKGSDKAVNDLLENVITNATKLIDASVKNLAMTKAVTNLADTGVITLIENPTYLDWKKLGSNKHGADKDGGVAMVRIEGKEQLVRINDVMLFNAITSIDQQPLDYPLRKLFAGAKRVLTATVTSMPNFIVRNFLRDMAQAWVVDRNNGFKLGVDSLKGLKDAYKRSGSAIDLMFAGASFGAGYVNGGNPQEAAVHIRKHLRKQGKSAAEIDGFMDGVIYSKDQLSKVLDQYFRVAQASENANRIAVYDRAIASGKSKAQAALESKDLMDFSMHGSAKALRLLADVLPFFNARLQGMSQLGRAFKENPRELAKRGAMIALASVALSAMNQGEDWYEEQSDEIKDNFWLANLGGQIIKIPKPFELGVVFGTIPERLYRTMSGADSTGRFKDRLLSAISNTLALNPIPQAVKPIFEVYNNYDSFRGREIESLSDRRLLKEARYDDRTSLLSRSLAGGSSAFGLSPKQTDHLIHGYFGTLGMYVLGMSDVAIRQAGGYGELPAKNWQEYPVLEAVFGGDVMVPRKYTRQMNDYYRFLNQVSEISATVKSYEEDGKTAQAATLKLENQRLLAYKPVLSQVQKQLKAVKGEMDMIQNSRQLNAEQKRQRLDRLRQHKNAIVRQVVERMEAEDF